MTTLPKFDERGRPVARLLPDDSVMLALGLTTLLALVLRLLQLGTPSLWVDELLTIQQGRMPGTTLLEQFLDDTQGPLSMVVTTLLARVSEHEFWLRLPSALLGTLTVPLCFEVARRIAGVRVALLASVLLAVHPMHVDHSQEVRGYAYLVFFGLATTWVFLDAGPRLDWKRAPLFVLLGLATCLSNLQGLFWMGGLALGVAVGGRVPARDWGRWAIAFGAIVLLATPWWSGAVRVHETGRLAPTADTGEALRGESTFTPFALPYAGFVLGFGDTLGPSDDELHAADGRSVPVRHLPAAVAAAIVVVVALVAGWRELDPRWRREMLAWAVVPIVLALLLAVRNVKPFNPRYVIAALPVLLIFAAAGIHRLGRPQGLVLLVAWLVLTGISLSRYWFDPAYAHEDVRGAAQLVADREGRDDAILVPAVGQVFRFYYRGDNPVSLLSSTDATRGGRSVDAALEQLATDRRYLWFVRSRPWFGDPRGALLESLQRRHLEIGHYVFAGVDVYLFDREQRPVSDRPEDDAGAGTVPAVPDSVGAPD